VSYICGLVFLFLLQCGDKVGSCRTCFILLRLSHWSISASESSRLHCYSRHTAGALINPLKTKRIWFIQGLSAYRAVNTLHFGYKNQSLNVL
jgi:hypothetical protein